MIPLSGLYVQLEGVIEMVTAWKSNRARDVTAENEWQSRLLLSGLFPASVSVKIALSVAD